MPPVIISYRMFAGTDMEIYTTALGQMTGFETLAVVKFRYPHLQNLEQPIVAQPYIA